MDVDLKDNQIKCFENDEIDSIQKQLSNIYLTQKDFIENLEYGKIQYKLNLQISSKEDEEKLISEIYFRLKEGNGECIYEIGLSSSGKKIGLSEEDLKLSIGCLTGVVLTIGADMEIIKFYKGLYGCIAEVLIRKQIQYDKIYENPNSTFITSYKDEVKIGFLGDEKTGKSTLVGVLVNGVLDNGEGFARKNIFRFSHEAQCGRTSSISHQLIGFDEKGNMNKSTNWNEILQKSSKIISLYDLGGSEKALKNTMSVMSENYIDYFFLVISAKQGITEMTKFFLNLANFMNFYLITIITKADLVSQFELEKLIFNYKCIIKNLKIRKTPLIVNSIDDIYLFSRNIDENIYPIFVSSNTNGFGLNFITKFMSNLNPKNKSSSNISVDNLTTFDIHEHFMLDKEKEGKLIVGGFVNSGKITVGQKFYLGPDKVGNFKYFLFNFRIVEVNDIHCKKFPVKETYEGQFSSVSIVKAENTNAVLKLDDIRKGMCLLDFDSSNPTSTKSFQAEIWSIDGSTKYIKYKYEPVLTIKHIRQTCKVRNPVNNCEKKYDEDQEDAEENKRKRKKEAKNYDECYLISPNEKTLLIFEFKNYPEFIVPGSRIIINDGHLKAVGIITNIIK